MREKKTIFKVRLDDDIEVDAYMKLKLINRLCSCLTSNFSLLNSLEEEFINLVSKLPPEYRSKEYTEVNEPVDMINYYLNTLKRNVLSDSNLLEILSFKDHESNIEHETLEYKLFFYGHKKPQEKKEGE